MEDYKEQLEILTKKVDKLLNLTTKIAKTLHLVPVTEREERNIQIMRERNAQQAYRVNEERADMKNEDADAFATVMNMFHSNLTQEDVFSDVLADDLIPQVKGD